MPDSLRLRKFFRPGKLWAALSAPALLFLLSGPAGEALAQFNTPPPLNSFELQEPDDEGLQDFFMDATGGGDGGYAPYPGPASASGTLDPPPSSLNNQGSSAAPASPAAAPPDPFRNSASSNSAPPLPPSVEPLQKPDESRSLGGNLPASGREESSGPWIQLEIGQADSSLPSSSGTLTAPPSSVSSIPREPSPAASEEATVNQVMDKAIQSPTDGPGPLEKPADKPSERQVLEDLFSDMRPPESESVRALSSGVTPPPLVMPAPAPQAPTPANAESDSFILRAGDLLGSEGQAGAAAILPPLDGKVDWRSKAAEESPKAAPAAPPQKAESPSPARSAAKAPAASAAPAAKSGQKKSGGQASKAKTSSKSKSSGGAKSGARASGPSPASVQLIIINETGSDRIGQLYGSVLGKIGYKVVSVADRQPGRGQTGQTVIHYRSGQKARAQAVARHLPGKKVLKEAGKGEVLGAEIMVYLR